MNIDTLEQIRPNTKYKVGDILRDENDVLIVSNPSECGDNRCNNCYFKYNNNCRGLFFVCWEPNIIFKYIELQIIDKFLAGTTKRPYKYRFKYKNTTE